MVRKLIPPPRMAGFFLLAVMLLAPGMTATAHLTVSGQAIWTDGGTRPVGHHLSYLPETGGPLDMEAVLAAQADGDFLPLATDVLSLGIGADPVWLHLAVHNPTTEARERVLVAGATWINRIDFHARHQGEETAHQVGGDASATLQRPLPGMGSLFRHEFPPGRTDIYLRAENPDPLLLPVRFLTPETTRELLHRVQYSYGMVYGFLFALLAYNFMLWLGLRRPAQRDYSLYLGAFIAMNMAYTGHGYAWLWPEGTGFQQYVILVLMVLFASAGLNFARSFLQLPEHSPTLARGLRLSSLAALGLMSALVVFQQQTAAAVLAFSIALAFTLVMFLLSWLALRHGYTAARYFVLAVFSGVVGIGVTTLTVWGWIPFTAIGFRAVEIGLLIEATLLALAVAYLVREHDRARQQAERLARIDALTGLLNRRALVEQGERVWSLAQRNNSPLSVVLLDLDHFKQINDAYGHATGDRVLIEAATILQDVCRKGDLAARWGGEEFLLLLPGAGRHETRDIAERVREAFMAHALSGDGATIALRASFGVATLDQHRSLDELIREADNWLYRAKEQGRNRICGHEGLPTAARPCT